MRFDTASSSDFSTRSSLVFHIANCNINVLMFDNEFQNV